MGRKRRRVNSDLPKYVYKKRGSYVYRLYLGVVDGRATYAPDVYLCPVSASKSAFWKAYEQATGERSDTLRWMLTKYSESSKFQALGKRTQEDYLSYIERICQRPIPDTKLVFGDAALSDISMRTIRDYLDKYRSPADELAPIAANRHIQMLKAAWNWARQYYDQVPANPCEGVLLNKQTARDRYVSREEFTNFKATTKGYIPIFMELAYLCRARWSEIAALKIADIRSEGLRLARGKGSKGEITAWTPRLSAAVAAAQAFNAKAPSPIAGAYLIHDKRGLPINQDSFQTAWGRAMRKWVAEGNERFTFHDLKAAGYTDQKIQDAGHKSKKMDAVYNRKLRVVEPAE